MTSRWQFRARIAGAIGAIAIMTATPSVQAQSPVPRLITQAINPTNLTTLFGNTRPEANAANDRGRVPDSMLLNHMLLQLQRSDVQEQAFDTLIDQLHDRNSPNFHKWLNVSEIGTRFGPAAADIQTITGWLQQNGFTVNLVYTNGMVIDFSGTAGQVRAAFHTEIHNLSVNGVAHIANMSDPEIATALAPVVVGIVSLHDFRPQPQLTVPPPGSSPLGQNFLPPPGTTTTQYYVGPGDLATVYNFNPVFNSGNVGQNQTIYLIEVSDVPVTNDWYTFRWVFGLPSYPTATLQTKHPAPRRAALTIVTIPV
jgi:subtilase family serine protease